MSEIPQDLVERMVALVRRMTAKGWDASNIDQMANHLAEARAIIAMLPEPIDPDLIEAEKIMALEIFGDEGGAAFVAGTDEHQMVQHVLLGIKRGRELERAK